MVKTLELGAYFVILSRLLTNINRNIFIITNNIRSKLQEIMRATVNNSAILGGRLLDAIDFHVLAMAVRCDREIICCRCCC